MNLIGNTAINTIRHMPLLLILICSTSIKKGAKKLQTYKFSILEKLPREIREVQYIPRNMHTVFALLCFVMVIHWLIFPYPSGLLHWHCDNLTIAPVPAKQPWWIWINTSCEVIMNDWITTTKQSTTKPCAYFLGYTVFSIAGQFNACWCPTYSPSTTHQY